MRYDHKLLRGRSRLRTFWGSSLLLPWRAAQSKGEGHRQPCCCLGTHQVLVGLSAPYPIRATERGRQADVCQAPPLHQPRERPLALMLKDPRQILLLPRIMSTLNLFCFVLAEILGARLLTVHRLSGVPSRKRGWAAAERLHLPQARLLCCRLAQA